MTGTKVLGPCTPELEASLAERRRLDQDRLDEVWQGVYHMNPGPHFDHGKADRAFLFAIGPAVDAAGLQGGTQLNIGEEDDYRVPDQAYVDSETETGLYHATAALVVEVLSPGDESRLKFGHYAAHEVDELVIVDPETQQIEWYALVDGRYEATSRSEVLGVDTATVVDAMRW
ncbi:MAG TPA: Uma2 family endonuclease [Acidimicrobiales bacterium]|nr:Uma2 family endonuclease [Acidimicrobiales bacterium]